MGANASTLLDAEKTSWVVPHKLNYDEELRKSQLALRAHFKTKLEMRHDTRKIFGFEYEHFWITDGTWILEFGGGDIRNNKVIIHCNPRAGVCITDKTFTLDKAVRKRIKKVCGATNYSLALRNCEHVARYIYSGTWICFQMVGKGALKKAFVSHMSNSTKLINTFPAELVPKKPKMGPLYSDKDALDDPADTGTIEFNMIQEVLTEADKDDYTILFLGPTGAGKSHLINNLFNLSVSHSGATIDSVTKEVKFYKGKLGSWSVGANEQGLERKFYNRPLTIIDTLGRLEILTVRIKSV